ncbi:phosphoglycerate kinase [Acidovorax sp. SRB_14]|uniref:histidine phosphatase family protein n=1 Tax=Acidovorax sp. SRB_14 TaxID=1962699 RepID=UPI00146EEE84|nr:histidine phosphatase family protein [Acidovorax sp. SRB_14]NMM80009.1 phosphoglycerate kinase [Acidovorax sp. SRB_14]NMM86252.1 phosphoglycerate kinase [Rhodococcus sp. SRB_17]
MTELILIRHGETDWNRELRFQGQVDVPLNATGHAQAQRLAQRLAREGVRADHLVSSDLLRTQQTAQPVLGALLPQLRLEALVDRALREQSFGVVDGMRVADIQAQHAGAWAQWLRFQADSGMPGGETTRQFHARVMDALRRLAQAHAGQTLVVVTHGGVLDMVWRTAHGLGLAGPRQSDIPNAAFNRVRMHGDAIDILRWADTRHLEGLPAQPVYDQAKAQADSEAGAALKPA